MYRGHGSRWTEANSQPRYFMKCRGSSLGRKGRHLINVIAR